MPTKPNGEICPSLKCSTCMLSCGCSWECLRGDDLVEIYDLRAELIAVLNVCHAVGTFANGVTHNGMDEGEVRASEVFHRAWSVLRGTSIKNEPEGEHG